MKISRKIPRVKIPTELLVSFGYVLIASTILFFCFPNLFFGDDASKTGVSILKEKWILSIHNNFWNLLSSFMHLFFYKHL